MNLNATIFFQMLVFFILGWITMKFVWPPLIKAIEERQKKIAEGLSAAEKGKKDLAEMQERIRLIDSSSKSKMREYMIEAENQASFIVEKAKQDAEIYRLNLLQQTEKDIENIVFEAKETLRQDLANLVVKGVEKILNREIDADMHQEILIELKEQL
ncbi:MAG: F0F1 ATP synthase subunit B [Bordetella sp.]|nr:MAG: F0F1 ATP synthase subunit B [Bordetella sp.]